MRLYKPSHYTEIRDFITSLSFALWFLDKIGNNCELIDWTDYQSMWFFLIIAVTLPLQNFCFTFSGMWDYQLLKHFHFPFNTYINNLDLPPETMRCPSYIFSLVLSDRCVWFVVSYVSSYISDHFGTLVLVDILPEKTQWAETKRFKNRINA